MIVDAAADRYAAALDAALGPEEAIKAEALLASVDVEVEAQPALKAALRHPLIRATAKRRVLERLFGTDKDGVGPKLGMFLEIVFARGRGEELSSMTEALRDLLDARQERFRGEVVSAVPLTDEDVTRLSELLAKRLGGKVLLSRRVDENLLGGFEVRVGGRLLDLSLRRRLDGIRRALGAEGFVATRTGKG